MSRGMGAYVIGGAAAVTLLLVASQSAAYACIVLPDGNPSNDWNRVLEQCNQMVERSPNIGMGFGNRAQAFLYGRGDADRAIADADKCISLYASHPNENTFSATLANCHMTRAGAYLKLGRYDDAIHSYDDALKIMQRDWMKRRLAIAYAERADRRRAHADYSGAKADYDSIASLNIDVIGGDLIERMVLAYTDLGQVDKAQELVTNLIRRDREHADAFFLRGRLRLAGGNRQGASEDFDEAVRLEPAEAEYRLERGRLLLLMGKLDAAVADFDAAITANPNADTYFARAMAHRAQRKYAAAVNDLNEAISRDGKSPAGYFNRGFVRAAMRDLAGALGDFDVAIRFDPNNPNYYTLRGLLRATTGNVDGAIADYGQAILLAPFDAQPYLMRAWALLRGGRPRDGLRDANWALTLEPGLVSALATRGRIYEELGRNAEAEADFNAAVARAPNFGYAKDALIRLRAH